MNLCDDGHQEVCYDGRVCPVCNVKSELVEKIEELETKIKELEERE